MREVNTVASKFAWVSRKRGFLVVIALIAALSGGRWGWDVHCFGPNGFFDGG
jgi:hypothetical protein